MSKVEIIIQMRRVSDAMKQLGNDMTVKKKSLTVIRNAKITGNNTKSYDDKHHENPVSMRPIHDAIKNTPKVFDGKNRFVPDVKKIRMLRGLAHSARPTIARDKFNTGG